jgi:hypothetical protein
VEPTRDFSLPGPTFEHVGRLRRLTLRLWPGVGRHEVLATAVRLERRGAVRTDDAKVLEPVVAPLAVDVVQDEGDALAAPELALATHLAPPLLQAECVEPPFDHPAGVLRVTHEHLLDRQLTVLEAAAPCPVGIEVVRRDLPDLVRPPPEYGVVAAGVADTQPSEGLTPVRGRRDRLARVSLGVSAWHERMFAGRSDSVVAVR